MTNTDLIKMIVYGDINTVESDDELIAEMLETMSFNSVIEITANSYLADIESNPTAWSETGGIKVEFSNLTARLNSIIAKARNNGFRPIVPIVSTNVAPEGLLCFELDVISEDSEVSCNEPYTDSFN